MVVFTIWWLPIVSFFSVLVTFATTYTIALFNNHVDLFWPYISETGTLPMESCYFSQLLNMTLVPISFTLFCRYDLMRLKIAEQFYHGVYEKLANALGILAVIFVFGTSIVANFQLTNFRTLHLIGAGAVFFSLFLYMFFDTLLSSLLNVNDDCSRRLDTFRLVLIILFLGCTILNIVFTMLSNRNEEYMQTTDNFHFGPEMEYHVQHLVATNAQWWAVMVSGIYLLTYIYDFKNKKMKMKSFCRKNHNTPETSQIDSIL